VESNGNAAINAIVQLTVEAQSNAVREFAIAAKKMKKGRIAVAFFAGESALPALWHDLMTIAAARGLPIVFVHHRNIETDESHTGPSTGKRDTGPYVPVDGIPTIVVDGGDAVALYRVGSEAIARARQGRGPTHVECMASSLATDSGSDCIYKKREGLATGDPVPSMEAYLERKGLLSENMKRQFVTDFNVELDLATRFLSD
jgi:pyruvate dehydrogenase E1 component alpha subunit